MFHAKKKSIDQRQRKTLTFNRNHLEIVFCLFILVICVAGVLYRSIQVYGENLNICKADYFVFIDDPLLYFKTFFLLPIDLFYLSLALKRKNRIQILIREKSRLSFFKLQIKELLKTTLFFTLALTLCTLVFSLCNTYPQLNWSQEWSVYWDFCGRQVLQNKELEFFSVVFRFFITENVYLCMMGGFFLLLHLMSNKLWISWVLCEGLSIYRTFTLTGDTKNGIIQKLSIDWKQWGSGTIWSIGLIMAGAVILFCFFIGKVWIKRKEFLNEK